MIERDGERSIAGTSEHTDITAPLLLSAKESGVPIFLPVADLEDLSSIDIDELWRLFPESTQRADKRYNTDATVMLRMYKSEEDVWNANWLLRIKEELHFNEAYDTDLHAVVGNVIADLAKYISEMYAVDNTASADNYVYTLNISGLNDFENFIKVQRYMEGLPPVANISLVSFVNDIATLNVILKGAKNQFYQHVELGGKLSRVARKQVPLIEGGDVTLEPFLAAEEIFSKHPSLDALVWHP